MRRLSIIWTYRLNLSNLIAKVGNKDYLEIDSLRWKVWGSVSKHFLKEVVCLPNLKPFPRLMAYGVAIMECLCPIPPYPIRLPPILVFYRFFPESDKKASYPRAIIGWDRGAKWPSFSSLGREPGAGSNNRSKEGISQKTLVWSLEPLTDGLFHLYPHL